MGIIVSLLFFAVVLRAIATDKKNDREYSEAKKNRHYNEPDQNRAYRYTGRQLKIPDQDYVKILSRHHAFFNLLNAADKELFIKRIKRFIARKVFYLYGPELVKEKPVLVAATAIQLSFGLKRYLLPNFTYIHVYPAEFLRTHPALCFLQGNVSGHSIRLSWKHFLEGLQNNTDGINVGLHEMAHAIYYQTFVTGRNVDTGFRKYFDDFNDDGNKVYMVEQAQEAGLYSQYAVGSFQEFWAESVEIFFEKPITLGQMYPDLYDAMKIIFNQDPAVRQRLVNGSM